MKNLKLFLALAMLLVAAGVQAQVNPNQKAAQKAVNDYLEQKGLNPVIDESDQSVTFKSDKELFWVSFDGNNGPMLYTLHTKGFSFKSDSKDMTSAERQQVALSVANNISANSNVKVYLSNGEVSFAAPAYYTTPTAYCEVLRAYIDQLKVVKAGFRKEYDAGITAYLADKEAALKQQEQEEVKEPEPEPTYLIVTQPQVTLKATPDLEPVKMEKFAVRVVDEAGQVKSAWDMPIRRTACLFVQPRISVSCDAKGDYIFATKIYTPEGLIMLPDENAEYTTVQLEGLKKDKKSQEIELSKFGYSVPNSWEAGEYRIEFYCNGVKIGEDTFNVL